MSGVIMGNRIMCECGCESNGLCFDFSESSPDGIDWGIILYTPRGEGRMIAGESELLEIARAALEAVALIRSLED